MIARDERVVAVLTGHLLKDPGAIVDYHPRERRSRAVARQPADRDRAARVGSRAGDARLDISRRRVKNCQVPRPPPDDFPLRLSTPPLMPSRLAVSALLVTFAVPLCAQGRGGRGGPDNRPEVTFPVDLPADDAKLTALKKEAVRLVDSMSDLLAADGGRGLQLRRARDCRKKKRSKYLTGMLEKNGFKVTRGFAGIPTAWVATWGSGKPVISLGSDVDDIPQANQKPGVGYKDPLVAGAPGHGEGHNSGVPMNITAAIAVKKIMEREHMPGTIQLWPGIAEEQMAAKAYFVRAGMFKDVDIVLFAHVGSDLGVSYGTVGTERAHQRAIQLRRPERRTPRARRGPGAARSTPSS